MRFFYTIFFLLFSLPTMIWAKTCLLVDVSAPLYKGNLSDETTYTFDNSHFAKPIIYNDKRTRLFVSLPNQDVKGWIDQDALLCNPGDSDLFSALSKNPKSPISLKKKALLATHLESLTRIQSQLSGGNKNGELQVNIYVAPNESAKYISSQSKLFQVRYIYKERIVDNIKFYLVGLNEAALIDNAHNVIQGWVREDRVLEWNNRIGVEFNPNDTIASPIYNDWKGSEVKYKESKKDHMKYYEPRFPLIKKVNKEVFKIGFIGGSDDGRISRGNIAKAQQIVNENIQNNYLQIALVIDATQGMKPYFKDVTKATNAFLEMTKNRANVDIAMVVYRDYADGEIAKGQKDKKGGIFEIIKDFKSDPTTTLEKISVKSNSNDRGRGAYPEALFYGIDKSIKTLQWSDKRIEKYLIVIGDHGNHTDAKQYPQEKAFSTLSLGQTMQKNLITLFGIQVANRANGKNLSAKQASLDSFKQQLQRIIAHNKGSLGKVTSYKKASDQQIQNALIKIYNNFLAIKDTLKNLNKSKDNERTGFSAGVLQRLGIDPKIFGQITQVTSTGYIKRTDKGFLQKVLIEKRSLEALKSSVSALSKALFRGSYHDEIGAKADQKYGHKNLSRPHGRYHQREWKHQKIYLQKDLATDTDKCPKTEHKPPH